MSLDKLKEFELLTKEHNSGNIDATNKLGIMYFSGLGIKKDYTKAFDLFTKAHNEGNIESTNFLGYMYDEGLGVKQDYNKAVELYTKAYNSGNNRAAYNLGYMYEHGNGVKQDYNKAVELYTKAYKGGDKDALKSLSFMYEERKGNISYQFISKINPDIIPLPEDYKLALELVKKGQVPDSVLNSKSIIDINKFNQFHNDNIKKCFMPNPSNYPINHTNLKLWLDKIIEADDPILTEFGYQFTKTLTHISFNEFYDSCCKLSFSILEIINKLETSGDKKIIFFVSELTKSTFWILMLVWKFIADKVDILISSFYELYKYIDLENNICNYYLFYLDDCSYSGNQIYKMFLLKIVNVNIVLHIINIYIIKTLIFAAHI